MQNIHLLFTKNGRKKLKDSDDAREYISKIVGIDDNDLVEDVFIKIANKIKEYEG